MTFVIINPHDKTVTLCDESVRVYKIEEFRSLEAELRNKDVLYVTEFVDTTGEEVMQIIEDLYYEESSLGDQTEIDEGELYLHTTVKSKYFVNHKNKNYFFSGMYDFKSLRDLPENFLTDCKMISDGIKSGVFRVVTEQQKNQIEQQKSIKIKESTKDKKENAKGSFDNPIEIDLGGTTSFKRNAT